MSRRRTSSLARLFRHVYPCHPTSLPSFLVVGPKDDGRIYIQKGICMLKRLNQQAKLDGASQGKQRHQGQREELTRLQISHFIKSDFGLVYGPSVSFSQTRTHSHVVLL